MFLFGLMVQNFGGNFGEGPLHVPSGTLNRAKCETLGGVPWKIKGRVCEGSRWWLLARDS